MSITEATLATLKITLYLERSTKKTWSEKILIKILLLVGISSTKAEFLWLVYFLRHLTASAVDFNNIGRSFGDRSITLWLHFN
ncbi:hypothetical protein H6F95_22045 [Cyanobacteria bacterium FACHB-471]|nr:hypothetical protein [Cyanobacteria bacterium FACHB-471]